MTDMSCFYLMEVNHLIPQTKRREWIATGDLLKLFSVGGKCCTFSLGPHPLLRCAIHQITILTNGVLMERSMNKHSIHQRYKM